MIVEAAAAAAAVPVAIVGAMTYASLVPTSNFWGPVIPHGPRDGRGVALTFDDGPTPGTTNRVLDELAKADARATFFVIGVNVKQHPDLLRRIHENGHLIANHSYHHSHYSAAGRQPYWERELNETDELIRSIIGHAPAIFRPPMGARTWHTMRALRKTGSTLVTWSQRAWDGFPTTTDRILRRFAPVAGGDILLMHDGFEPQARARDRAATIGAIGPLVAMLRERGLAPMRLDEMLGIPGYRRATAT